MKKVAFIGAFFLAAASFANAQTTTGSTSNQQIPSDTRSGQTTQMRTNRDNGTKKTDGNAMGNSNMNSSSTMQSGTMNDGSMGKMKKGGKMNKMSGKSSKMSSSTM